VALFIQPGQHVSIGFGLSPIDVSDGLLIGVYDPSEAQSIIARRATTLAVWCEQTEAKAAAGEPLNVTEFTTATNALRRFLNDLGLERRMRDITPTIDSYLART
jgi:hypothetical protein